MLFRSHPLAAANFSHVERLAKFLLWQRGGWRFHFTGPKELAAQLQAHFRDTATGKFDSHLIGERVYDRPIEVHACDAASLPPERANVQSLGRNLDGCRIGFDLGGSDRYRAGGASQGEAGGNEYHWDASRCISVGLLRDLAGPNRFDRGKRDGERRASGEADAKQGSGRAGFFVTR